MAMSKQQEEQVENANRASTTTFWSLVMSMLPLIWNFALSQMWEAIDIIQLVYIMLYINV